MNVEIGTEAAQFPEKEYINGIFFAVYEVIIIFYYSVIYFYKSGNKHTYIYFSYLKPLL